MYPGIVEEMYYDSALVSVMEKYGQFGWRWPKEKDPLPYEFSDITKRISAPIPINKRGIYKIKEMSLE